MDIGLYKKYVRDLEISDEDLTDIINSVIRDIAQDTKIFRHTFSFTLESCLDLYNIKDLYNLSTSLDDTVEDVIYHENNDSDKTINMINSITIEEGYGASCDDGNDSNNIEEKKVYTNSGLEYISTIDLLYYGSRYYKYDPESVLTKFFIPVDNDTFLAKHDYLVTYFGSSNYKEEIIASVCVSPNKDKITTDQENIIREAIIAGIKYNVADMYLNTANEQVGNILYQRYYSAKKQIRNNYPTLVSPLDFKYNAAWNV